MESFSEQAIKAKAKPKATTKKQPQRTIALAVVLLGLVLIAVALWGIGPDLLDDFEARREYSGLRKDFTLPDDMDCLREVNSDLVGWLVIPGTRVNYPVVQGQDNVKYLKTTFRGKQNPAGAIFMDYRITAPFASPTSMVYGHNMRDGSMFATLNSYLDADFLSAHSEVVIYTPWGETLYYQILKARRVFADDPVFSLDFNDPDSRVHFDVFFESPEVDEGAVTDLATTGDRSILVLSTCSDGQDGNARVVVVAVK